MSRSRSSRSRSKPRAKRKPKRTPRRAASTPPARRTVKKRPPRPARRSAKRRASAPPRARGKLATARGGAVPRRPTVPRRARRSRALSTLERIEQARPGELRPGTHPVAESRYVTPTRKRGFKAASVRAVFDRIARSRKPAVYTVEVRARFNGPRGKRRGDNRTFSLPRTQDIAREARARGMTPTEFLRHFVEAATHSALTGAVQDAHRDFGATDAVVRRLGKRATRKRVQGALRELREARGIKFKLIVRREVAR